MTKRQIREIKPFVSLMMVFLFLFLAVFLKMEARRLGYHVLKLTHQMDQLQDEARMKRMQLARLTRPSNIQRIAKGLLTLKKGSSGQYIHLAGLYPRNLKVDR